MGSIGDAFTTAVPVVGSAGPGFATDIDAILTEAIARLSVKVPLSSLATSGTLNMNGNPITNVGYMTLTDSLVSPPASPVNRLTTYLGDLWYVSPSSPIKLTTGGTLNSGALGGITGDYGGANPAQFRFVDANQRYDAYDDFAGGAWGFVRARGFDIAAGATSALFARLAFGGAGTVTYTLPPNAPTVTSPLLMDSSGNITTQAPRIYNFSASEGVPKGDAVQDVVTFAYPVIKWGSGVAGNKAACAFNKALTGETITAWTLNIDKSVGTGQLDVKLMDLTVSAGTTAQIGATQSSSSSGVVSFGQGGLSAAITGGHIYFLQVSAPGTANIGGDLRNYAFTVQ